MQIFCVKDIRSKYVTAHREYMTGKMSYEEFLPIKKEWAEASKSIAKKRGQCYSQIEKDLANKYPQTI